MTTNSELVPYMPGQADVYRPQIMTPEAARALDEQVRMCTRAVLREGTDYGAIPGTGDDRKVLLKPGAEKLLQWFGFGFRCDRLEVDTDDEGRKQGVTYRCVITRRIGDPHHGLLVDVTTCEGYAGYDEPKFYKSAEQAQRDAEAKERHWARKDRRVANPEKWKHLGEYRAPWNTVIKMAQKRAIVGAAITATAAAGLFTDEDQSADAPADGGPSWYQRALGEAAAITTKEDGDRLANEATQAVLGGIATPGQADHVKNRIGQRLRQLGAVRVVDVEDLAEATARHGLRPPRTQTAPPAQKAAPPRAAEPSPPETGAGGALPLLPGEDEPAPAAQDEPAAGAAPDRADRDTHGTATRGKGGQLTALWTILSTEFGFTNDEKSQARAVCEHIVRRELTGGTTGNLSYNEARTVLDTLAHWQQQAQDKGEHPRDYLIAVMAAQEEASDAG